jgi:hypothetical protein
MSVCCECCMRRSAFWALNYMSFARHQFYPSSNVKIQVAGSSEMSVHVYQTTRRQTPKNQALLRLTKVRISILFTAINRVYLFY